MREIEDGCWIGMAVDCWLLSMGIGAFDYLQPCLLDIDCIYEWRLGWIVEAHVYDDFLTFALQAYDVERVDVVECVEYVVDVEHG